MHPNQHPVHCYDWDGTLVTDPGPTQDPATLSLVLPLPAMIEAQALHRCGEEVHIITGRCQPLIAMTLEQVQKFLDPRFPADRIHHHPGEDYQGPEALIRFKTEKLKELGASRFMGNTHTDAEAARRAKVPFEFIGALT